MIRHFFIILLSITIYSCHFLGPRDSSNESVIKSLTEFETLSGKWIATEPTYELLKEKKYTSDSVRLTLNSDSTFEFINLPDCINNSFGDPLNGKLLNAKGKWRIYQFGDDWKLQMTFEKSDLFDELTFMDFEISRVDSTFKLWQYIGDPDQADILEFGKR